MTHDEMIAVIQAAKEGKRIEYRNAQNETANWYECSEPVWNFAIYDYRVKPEPKPDVVMDYVGIAGASHIYTLSALRTPPKPNLRLTYDGETGKLKSAEVLP